MWDFRNFRTFFLFLVATKLEANKFPFGWLRKKHSIYFTKYYQLEMPSKVLNHPSFTSNHLLSLCYRSMRNNISINFIETCITCYTLSWNHPSSTNFHSISSSIFLLDIWWGSFMLMLLKKFSCSFVCDGHPKISSS